MVQWHICEIRWGENQGRSGSARTRVVGTQSNSTNTLGLGLRRRGEPRCVVSAFPERPREAKALVNCVRSHPSPRSQVLIRAAAAQEAEWVEKVTAGTSCQMFQFSLCLSLADCLWPSLSLVWWCPSSRFCSKKFHSSQQKFRRLIKVFF